MSEKINIIFSYNLNEIVNTSEKLANNVHGKINFGDYHDQVALRKFEPKLKIKHKIRKIDEIINTEKGVEMQVLDLNYDPRFSFRKYLESLEKTGDVQKYEKPILCFVFKRLDNFAFAIFVDIKTKIVAPSRAQRNTSVPTFAPEIELKIKRIEYFNINYLDNNFKTYELKNDGISVDFIQNEKNKSLELSKFLAGTKKICNAKQQEDQRFGFFKWRKIVRAFNELYNPKANEKEADANYLVIMNDIFNNNEKVEDDNSFKLIEGYILLSKKGIPNNDKVFLNVDDSVSIPIRINKTENSNLQEEIKKQTEDVDSKIEDQKLKIIERKKEQENLETNLEKVLKQLHNNKAQLNKFEDQRNLLSKEKQLLQIANNKNKDDEEDESKKEEIKRKLVKIDQIQAKLIELNIPIKKIEAEIKETKYLENKTNQELEKARNDLLQFENKIKNLQKKKSSLENFAIYIAGFKIKKIIISSNYRESDDKYKISFEDSLAQFKLRGKLYLKIEEDDVGKKNVLRRLNFAMKNIEDGLYKNPYIFHSLFTLPAIDSTSNDVSKNTLDKYELNANQKRAVTKAINTRDVFYLQGPPGTGKTQTLCAISQEEYKFGKNILITSHSHEAVNNLLDRLHEKNPADPNLILFKYRFGEINENFQEDELFPIFLRKIYNFAINENPIEQSIKEYEEKYGNEIPKINLNNKEINYLNEQIDDGKKDFLKNKRIKNIFKGLRINSLDDLDANFNTIKEYYNIPMFKKINQIPMEADLIKDWDNIINWLPSEKMKIFNNISEVKELFSGGNSKEFNIFLNNFKNFYLNNNDYFKGQDDKFLDLILRKKEISVIGITTTSRSQIQIKDKAIDLFSDYPIDIVLFDEISKSSTPEILSRVIFSEKIIFSGDYKQLPPISNFTEDECKWLVEIGNERETKHVWKLIQKSGSDEFMDEKELFREIETIHKDSFFKIQVKEIIGQNTIVTKKPYNHLTVQHRFNENIMDVVNSFYLDEEKLIMGKNKNSFARIKLKISGKDLSEDFCLIDTSYINKKSRFHNKRNESSKIDSYDSTLPTGGSRVNHYNANVIATIVKNLINQNLSINFRNKIGVISFSRTQTRVIRQELEKIIGEKIMRSLKIKIDTVDNFQGREKEIIIVDFVRAFQKEEDRKPITRRNLDFLAVPERINVAISRAQAKLIVVGAFSNHYLEPSTIKNRNSEAEKILNAIWEKSYDIDSYIDIGELDSYEN